LEHQKNVQEAQHGKKEVWKENLLTERVFRETVLLPQGLLRKGEDQGGVSLSQGGRLYSRFMLGMQVMKPRDSGTPLSSIPTTVPFNLGRRFERLLTAALHIIRNFSPHLASFGSSRAGAAKPFDSPAH